MGRDLIPNSSGGQHTEERIVAALAPELKHSRKGRAGVSDNAVSRNNHAGAMDSLRRTQ